MNEETLSHFSNFAVENKSRKKELPYLLDNEQKVYQYLQKNDKRLEQERISQQYILEQLNAVNLGGR